MQLRCRLKTLKYKIATIVSIFVVVITLTFILESIHLTIRHDKRNCKTTEPIDAVYTWVNGSDPKFQADLNEFLGIFGRAKVDFSAQRFDDKHELKFSLRSLEKFAPWINHIYIVTNGQIPYWLNLDCDKLTLVTHEEIFSDSSSSLPTFSSPAIESQLHRIPGLSKYFLYLNDDVFFGAPVHPQDFLTSDMEHLLYMAYPLPVCAPDCAWSYVNDGQCDATCYNENCQFDGGDCGDSTNIVSAEGSQEKLNSSEIHRQPPINITYLLTQLSLGNATAVPTVNITSAIKRHNLNVMLRDKLKRQKRSDRRSKLLDLWLNRTSKLRRRLRSVDTYGSSLQHTNRMLNLRYGFVPRYVPAHSVVFVDRDAQRMMVDKFPAEFGKTKRNRVRSVDDMQFSFSFYYFLVHEKMNRNISDVFDEFDVDSSGTWSDREIRTLLAKLYELPLTYGVVDHFEYLLANCSDGNTALDVPTPEYERYVDSRLPTITKALVTNCKALKEILIQRFGLINKYKYKFIKNAHSNNVIFKMLRSNVTEVVTHLDEIRREPKKFICLNDNLDDSESSENEFIRALLYDFYLSIFPKSSQFELNSDYKNKFLYVRDLRKWKSQHIHIKAVVYLFVVVLMYVTIFTVCKRKYVCSVFKKIFC